MVDIVILGEYIPVDNTDPLIQHNLERALASAQAAVKGSVGEDIDDVLPDDPRVDQLTLLYAKDFFEERELSGKSGAGHRALVNTLESQLRLERRRILKERSAT